MSGVGSPAFLPPAKFVRSPEAMDRNWSPEEGRAYTRWLATNHYENFHVVSFLLPKRLHQDFYNVYAYCRWPDDLADEIGDPAESLRLLAWWRGELDGMYHLVDQSSATHPVFAALRPTVEQYGIPRQPFSDLIDAFVQDQTVTRYRSWDELFRYCRNSANPVGRLVLYLGGYSDAVRQSLSDATCTALQLANFWQSEEHTSELQSLRHLVCRLLLEKKTSESAMIFFFNDTATTEIYTLSLHDALPICDAVRQSLSDATCTALQLANFW